MDHPKCTCGTEYVWDWQQDIYRIPQTGQDCEVDAQPPITLPEFLATHRLILDTADLAWFKTAPTELIEASLFRCATCAAVIAGWVHDADYGAIVVKRSDWPTWQNVDWEAHAYEEEMPQANPDSVEFREGVGSCQGDVHYIQLPWQSGTRCQCEAYEVKAMVIAPGSSTPLFQIVPR